MAKPIDPLARSSIEAYGGIVAGIVAAFVTSWWAKGLLLALAAGLLIHVAFRSKHSINWPLWGEVDRFMCNLVDHGCARMGPAYF
jgi:hypothetical protein